jgi:hypothetical protein
MLDTESITISGNLPDEFFSNNKIFATPINASVNEKKMLIARTARISSAESIGAYQCQIFGTKKCHTPKPMVKRLPTTVSVTMGILGFAKAMILDRFPNPPIFSA